MKPAAQFVYATLALALLSVIAVGEFRHPHEALPRGLEPGPAHAGRVTAESAPLSSGPQGSKAVPAEATDTVTGPGSGKSHLSLLPISDQGTIPTEAVHKALIEHPEWLQEMSEALQHKQQAQRDAQLKRAIAANRESLHGLKDDPIVGAADGDVTIVEFFDYQCPFCKRLAPEVEKLIKTDSRVRVVYKEFPILDPASAIAAKAALAAQAQDKYEAFHNALLADTTKEHELTEVHIVEVAKTVGIDVDRLKADMAKPELDAQIAANRQLAQSIGITGTPGLIIDDGLVPGALPYDRLVQLVAQQRGASRSAVHVATP